MGLFIPNLSKKRHLNDIKNMKNETVEPITPSQEKCWEFYEL